MNNWSVRTSQYAIEQREQVWRHALQKVYLSMAAPCEAAVTGLRGEVVYCRSPLGTQFVKLAGSPQAIVGSYPLQSTSATNLWIALMLEGTATLRIEDKHCALEIGDILYGAGGVDNVELHLSSDFRILTVEMTHEAFYRRLINPGTIRAGTISGRQGVNQLLSDFLFSVAARMESLAQTSFYPIEMALSELLTYCLSHRENDTPRFRDQGQEHRFRAICHSIDLHLGDSDLNLEMVARLNNVSPRYVQKIFAETNSTFSHFLRQRRLEQCKKDLSSREHASLSVSEICFRWGFNDLAYFSRAFSAKYACSPRAFRAKMLADATPG